MATTFKYLGRVLTELDDDWLAVVANMRKVQRRWELFSSILGREGAEPRTYGNLYKVVVQANLLFGADTWVVSPIIGRNIGGFHHRVARRLTVMRPRQGTPGRWVYLLL